MYIGMNNYINNTMKPGFFTDCNGNYKFYSGKQTYTIGNILSPKQIKGIESALNSLFVDVDSIIRNLIKKHNELNQDKNQLTMEN